MKGIRTCAGLAVRVAELISTAAYATPAAATLPGILTLACSALVPLRPPAISAALTRSPSLPLALVHITGSSSAGLGPQISDSVLPVAAAAAAARSAIGAIVNRCPPSAEPGLLSSLLDGEPGTEGGLLRTLLSCVVTLANANGHAIDAPSALKTLAWVARALAMRGQPRATEAVDCALAVLTKHHNNAANGAAQILEAAAGVFSVILQVLLGSSKSIYGCVCSAS